MVEHINIKLKVTQGYFCKYVLTWVLSRLGLARFAVDRWHRVCIDRWWTLNVDLELAARGGGFEAPVTYLDCRPGGLSPSVCGRVAVDVGFYLVIGIKEGQGVYDSVVGALEVGLPRGREVIYGLIAMAFRSLSHSSFLFRCCHRFRFLNAKICVHWFPVEALGKAIEACVVRSLCWFQVLRSTRSAFLHPFLAFGPWVSKSMTGVGAIGDCIAGHGAIFNGYVLYFPFSIGYVRYGGDSFEENIDTWLFRK
ncbi:hypothetical protein F2Q69_00017647 [Brassica cretica]|uniref:Uncharacterized protein n=1 Tax=Brassica cretica TaxID=69181 RepID=A0A8S9QWB5_BRACR|nr:hypothetical protein F2Q69_00017647 [Brassica cretica]